MKIRPAAVAGGFYPDDPRELATQVAHYLAAAAPAGPAAIDGLRALVVPHAGYIYSGPTAGVGYRLLPALRGSVQRVVMVGPAHYVPVRGVAVSSMRAWATPLGDVEVDAVARAELLARAEELVADESTGVVLTVAVDDVAHAPEHCIEVQLPFLQSTLPGVPILPLLVGTSDSVAVAQLLAPWWDDPATLLLVSTDLSHYETAGAARRHDARTAATICRVDADGVDDDDACGARPLRAVLRLAAQAGARVRLLDLRNSADTAGNPLRVVGYGSFVVEA